MSSGYGWPPASDEIAETIQRRLDDVRDHDNPETIRVQFRGSALDLHVIAMPIAQLYLNPNTHRIRAQRGIDPSRNARLDEAPWADDSQAYLEELLKARPSDPTQPDPEYAELLEELRRDGQISPGVVTQTGVLVDANTRCVALKELGTADIRVGILPPSADWNDINQMELRIQLRRDKRRDYPYINRLISVEEQIASGSREEDVAHEWNIRPASLKADRWAFQLIKDAVARSESAGGARLTELHFNDQQESFRELHRHYTTAAAVNPDAAEQLKESRLAALMLGLPKTSLRHVEEDFHKEYLVRHLPAELLPTTPPAAKISIPGLPADLPVGQESDHVRTARALTDSLLKARADQNSHDPKTAAAGSAVVTAANEAFRDAAKAAERVKELQKKRSAVADHIAVAADCVVQSSREFARSRADRTLDLEAFDEALLVLRESLEQLAKQAARAADDDAREGINWLLAATRQED
ncbi:hypothetical protein GCM10028772_12840 [Nocardioides ultimimeridianus]